MQGIEVYIGSLIEHASDRTVLEHVVEYLMTNKLDGIILANVEIKGRQIDLILALAELTLVIEAKASVNPLRGSPNGQWEVKVPSGWKKINNFYQQTLSGAYALRDEMKCVVSSEVSYATAALVFVPGVPPASEISTNYKVSVIGLDGLDALLECKSSFQWTPEEWRRFAVRLRLTKVNNVEACFDSRMAEWERLTEHYLASFRRTYGPLAAELIPFGCALEGESAPSDRISRSVATGTNLLLCGPSGCGKTLLASKAALESADTGRIPIVVRAKDFTGNLRDTIEGEVTLLSMPSAKTLVYACRNLNRQIVFIVDGFNECVASERSRLMRSLAAACRRYEASVLITSQSFPERGDLLDLVKAQALAPGQATKEAIARRISGISSLTPAMRSLIDSVESGLEARLIGESGLELPPTASRFAVFDAFVRRKLGDAPQEAMSALVSIAQLLTDRVSFSLSIRDLDRLAGQASIPPAVLRQLVALRLVTTRADRASFAHELFLGVFAAEAVIRGAAGNSAGILRALQMPWHEQRKTLIVGAIDDHSLLASVLQETSDAGLIEACLSGQCGGTALAWATEQANRIFARMLLEANQAKFELSAGGFLGVAVDKSSLTPWSAQERVFLATLGAKCSVGYELDRILEIVTATDYRLEREYVRLLPAARGQKVEVRSGLFANAYITGSSLGIGLISKAIVSGRIRFDKLDMLSEEILERISNRQLSSGQLYFLLAIARQARDERCSLAPLLPSLLRQHWLRAPYHLQLDLLWAVQMCALSSDAEKRALIDALEELPSPQSLGVSSSFIDALKSLGALGDDEEDHLNAVRSQIQEVLDDQDDPEMRRLACGIWFSQFDHPYEGAYYEAIAELTNEDRKSLLTMAAHGTDPDTSFFVSILIIELASFNDPVCGGIIDRWTSLPAVDSIMPQEAMNIFATAHIALARLGILLSDTATAESTTQQAIAAIGKILYWINRHDMPIDQRRVACKDALKVLLCHELGVSAGGLLELSRSYLSEGLDRLPGFEPVYTILGDVFPSEVAEIFRQALLHPERQIGYSLHSSVSEILSFAADALGCWGSPADIAFLRSLATDQTTGSAAIRAIKRLEERQSVPSENSERSIG
ncbi:MAG: NERD domain-containing protein [Geminicoccaceae bacterium]